MANSLISDVGITFTTSGSTTPVAIKYCVPVYDYRLDPTIHTGSTSVVTYASTIAQTEDQLYPTGEIIWNISGYDLSTNFIVSGVGDAVDPYNITHLSAYKQSIMGVGVNTNNEIPLSPSHSGTSFSPPNVIASNYWDIFDIGSNIGITSASNITPSDKSLYWKVLNYNSIKDDSDNDRGVFKCNISGAAGTFKFNKVALYAVQLNADGTETSDDPVFFAESFLNDVPVKSNLSDEGCDDFVIDIQLDMSSVNTWGTSAFFASSGDYWSRVKEGLSYSNCVGIGSFSESDDILGTLHLKKSDSSLLSLEGLDGSKLALDVVTDNYISATGMGFIPEKVGASSEYIPTGYFNEFYANAVEGSTTSVNISAINANVYPLVDNTVNIEKAYFDDLDYTNLIVSSATSGYFTASGSSTNLLVQYQVHNNVVKLVWRDLMLQSSATNFTFSIPTEYHFLIPRYTQPHDYTYTYVPNKIVVAASQDDYNNGNFILGKYMFIIDDLTNTFSISGTDQFYVIYSSVIQYPLVDE